VRPELSHGPGRTPAEVSRAITTPVRPRRGARGRTAPRTDRRDDAAS
jgi:hypothetical protein